VRVFPRLPSILSCISSTPLSRTMYIKAHTRLGTSSIADGARGARTRRADSWGPFVTSCLASTRGIAHRARFPWGADLHVPAPCSPAFALRVIHRLARVPSPCGVVKGTCRSELPAPFFFLFFPSLSPYLLTNSFPASSRDAIPDTRG
jgi:hypothetical protein